MSHWESSGKSDEWYTPKYIFDALGCRFDMDVAGPGAIFCFVPAADFLSAKSLESGWYGFVWMNPPFGGRNSLEPWLDKFFAHGDGIALVPDRTSAPWFQKYARQASSILFLAPKVKFIRPCGATGDSPSTGTALLAAGTKGVTALHRARDLGLLTSPVAIDEQQIPVRSEL